MSKRDSSLDLPALSADESGGNMTDGSNMDQLPHQQKNYASVSTAPFIDSNFFYSLDQLAPDNPLFFMQQQQQHNESTMYGDQFLKETVNGEGSSSATVGQSISSSMASFQAAITSSVGEQPPSFWTGLNNVNNFNLIYFNSN